MSSSYENIVTGKLKLKGKALDVKSGGVKKKKKLKHHYDNESQTGENEHPSGEGFGKSVEPAGEAIEGDKSGEDGHTRGYDEHLTPAERRYIEQRGRIDRHFMAKNANKSHRDRIQGFNQYLANLSEHYDIPKVGPG
ncbi:hypothetical protein KSP39_PZI018174 [Platanthera zijinensis]|uniref:Protein FAM32A-like n=1 Tax=Platanthera zijinensis TaxID=2320716 RepID=A0AAP0B2U8_9ASPA